MFELIKAIALLFIGCTVYYMFGQLACSIVRKPEDGGVVFKTILGFMFYQLLFMCCGFPMIIVEQSLHNLAWLWSGVLTVVLICSILCGRIQYKKDISNITSLIRDNKLVMAITLAILLLVIYFVCTHGESNDDSLYYIGLINTTLTTDSLYQYNVYTGLRLDSLYFRRIFTTFDIHSAVVCFLAGVHPLIETRITRAALHVILTAGSLYLLGRRIYAKEKSFEKSCVLVCLVFALYFCMNHTIYTNATFFLSRTYEGKAYAGNVIVYFLLYLCIRYMAEHKKSILGYIVLSLGACAAISTSAILVGSVEVLILFFTHAVIIRWQRRKECRA